MLLQRLRLSDTDLDFVVDEAVPESRNKESLKQLIREDEDFRKALIGDERVFARIMADEEVIPRISSTLYFEILLRKALKELEQASHTVERTGTETVVVFDSQEVADLLGRQEVLSYLADVLTSFTRIESYVRRVRVRKGIWRKVRFNDMDINSLMRSCEGVDEEHRFGLYKRIADVCLFILGVFPEYSGHNYRHPISGAVRPRTAGRARRNAEEYEMEGKRFYRLAGAHPAARDADLSELFGLLHERFHIAMKPLNFISAHYLHYRKHNVFGAEMS